MRIGIDARMIDWTGVGRYTQNLLKSLVTIDQENEYVLFCHEETEKLAPEASNFIKKIVSQPVFSLASQLGWAREVSQAKPDIFHSPHFVLPLLFSRRTVVTIHDLIPMLFPKNLPSRATYVHYNTMIKLGVRKAQKIIAVSASTKNDLIRLVRIPPEKIVVIPEAADARYKPVQDEQRWKQVKERQGIQRKFLLYVGNYKPHKNLVRLVKAFSQLPESLRKEHQLVLVGKKDKRYPEVGSLVKKLNLKRDVTMLGFLSEDDLLMFYNAAQALILPSLYEGFGLPPLEAMACGTPVIASNVSSIPEVVGDAALLLSNQQDVNEIAKAMEKILTDENLRKDLRAKGLARAKQFSWKRTAEETLQVYREVVGS